jgi:hypothetical protein
MKLPPNKLVNPNGPVKLHGLKPVPPPLVGPFLPLGGDYADVLAYFVERGRPTYQFTGMPVTKALVAIELWAPVAIALLPFVYLFLDASIASQSWYYVSAYLSNGGPVDNPSTGAVSGSPGPMTLISNDLTLPPNEGIMSAYIPSSQGCTVSNEPGYTFPGLNNPMLQQVTFGSAPALEPSWW